MHFHNLSANAQQASVNTASHTAADKTTVECPPAGSKPHCRSCSFTLETKLLCNVIEIHAFRRLCGLGPRVRVSRRSERSVHRPQLTVVKGRFCQRPSETVAKGTCNPVHRIFEQVIVLHGNRKWNLG